ncbi:MAG: VIT1/CCC1 transporter family protein [Parcubacteria group bacterium]|nr:VIT1/CCC1 transporter family protein [Parcubacteria group bacterium]
MSYGDPNPDGMNGERLKAWHGEDWHTPKGRFIREVVFGINDGLVTTVGFLAGVSGAILDNHVVLFAGIASAAAGAISMALGAYLSTKSQQEFFRGQIRREQEELTSSPERERTELHHIFSEYKLAPEVQEAVINKVMANKKLALKLMMHNELGIIEEDLTSPIRIGLLMGVSFVVGALPPLAPYFLFENVKLALGVALIVSLTTLFIVGAAKVLVTSAIWWRSAIETTVVGTLAAGLGYLVGIIVAPILGTGVTL